MIILFFCSFRCHGSTYPIPTGSIWIDKSDIDVDAPLPPNIGDIEITLHYITSDGTGSVRAVLKPSKSITVPWILLDFVGFRLWVISILLFILEVL